MGTLLTVGTRARVKIRDVDILIFTNAQLMGMVNDILETIYQSLVFISSNLVYTEGTIDIEADVMEYTPDFTHNGFLRNGVWLDGEDTFLPQVTESDKVKYSYDTATAPPEAYYLTEDDKVGFLCVPDDDYTVHVEYWEPLTELDDYDDDDLPWGGIFNRYIQRALVVECLETLERDPSRQGILADMEWGKALNLVYARGLRKEKQVSDMFSVEGI